MALSVIAVANSAVALEPTSASQLVALRAQTGTGFQPCPNAGNHFVQVLPNATFGSAPFSVSKGNIFVATGFQWDMGGVTPGEAALAAVTIEDGANSVGVVFWSATPGSAGDGGGSEAMPTGVRNPCGHRASPRA